MDLKSVALIVLFLLIKVDASDSFSYSSQGQWTGSCNSGNSQSPIDIPCQQFISACPLNKKYQIYWKDPIATFGGSLYQDLKTFFTNKNSWVSYSNQTNDYLFSSAQFHLHSPSEHTINGQSYPLQMHIVHKLQHPTIVQYAVVGLLFQVDETLESDIFDYVPIYSTTNFTTLFPLPVTNSPTYHYRGSLTTPPCTQAVNWFLQIQPTKISKKNFDLIKQKINEGHFNNRLTQKLNSRPVYLIGQGC